MWKLIYVQCQKCGMVTEAFIDTLTRDFKLYPKCECVNAFHDEIQHSPDDIIENINREGEKSWRIK